MEKPSACILRKKDQLARGGVFLNSLTMILLIVIAASLIVVFSLFRNSNKSSKQQQNSESPEGENRFLNKRDSSHDEKL